MTSQTQMTTSEFAAFALASDQRMELVDGEIITLSLVSLKHSRVVGKVLSRLTVWAENGAGGMVGTELGFNLDPQTVRAADVYYISPENSVGMEDYDGFWDGAPDLAVEVVSPTERASDIEAKISDYLAAGTRLMWIIYPRTRTVHVIRPNEPRPVLNAADTLSAPDILPGFALSVATLFE